MSDQESISTAADHLAPPPQPMDAQTDLHHDSLKSEKLSNVTFSIWPPTQRTRDAVIKRLVETLSSPSVLSKRYGTIPAEEADSTARLIEDEAYSAALASASADDDGIAILQVYSREISKRMLEAVKVRTSSGSPAPDGSTAEAPGLGSGPEPSASSEDAQSES